MVHPICSASYTSQEQVTSTLFQLTSVTQDELNYPCNIEDNNQWHLPHKSPHRYGKGHIPSSSIILYHMYGEITELRLTNDIYTCIVNMGRYPLGHKCTGTQWWTWDNNQLEQCIVWLYDMMNSTIYITGLMWTNDHTYTCMVNMGIYPLGHKCTGTQVYSLIVWYRT